MKDLNRFIEAQARDYSIALAEITAGKKRSHWIWYIFPQLKGLGKSHNSNYFGLDSLDEAIQYYNHPILGKRLKEITTALLDLENRNPMDIMGRPDDRKLKSCMTLFSEVHKRVGQNINIFNQVISQLFNGKYDKKTLSLIKDEKPVYFIRFCLKSSNGTIDKYIYIDTILAVKTLGYIYKIVHLKEEHYDNLSDGNEELLPKVGEQVLDSKHRIEEYIDGFLEWGGLKTKIEIEELNGLSDYVNGLITNR